MDINKLTVNWMQGYGNSPSIQLEVNELPKFDSTAPIWTAENNRHVWAMIDGVICYTTMGQPTESGAIGGFGGREITRTLTNGTVLKSRDCWSGNPRGLPMEAVDCSLLITGERVATSYSITYELALRLLTEQGLYLVKGSGGFWSASISKDTVTKPTE